MSDASFDLINSGLPFRPKILDDWIQMDEKKWFYFDPWNASRKARVIETANNILVTFYHDLEGELLIHRVGGPACYEYSKTSQHKTIKNLRFYLRNEEMSAFDYYDKLSCYDEFNDATWGLHFFEYDYDIVRSKGKEENHIVTLNAATFVPCPYKMYSNSETMLWRLGGKRVSMATYFTCLEQVFSGIDRKKHLSPAVRRLQAKYPED